jgi:hypothetical protein
MSSSNTETNSKKNELFDDTIAELKKLGDDDTKKYTISLQRLQQDIMEIEVIDEDGPHYSNHNVEDVMTLYDPLMKKMKIIVKSRE